MDQGPADPNAKQTIVKLISSVVGPGRFTPDEVVYNLRSSHGKLIVFEYTAQMRDERMPSVAQIELQCASILKALDQSTVPWDRVWINADIYNATDRDSDKIAFAGRWDRSSLKEVDWNQLNVPRLMALAAEPPTVAADLRGGSAAGRSEKGAGTE